MFDASHPRLDLDLPRRNGATRICLDNKSDDEVVAAVVDVLKKTDNLFITNNNLYKTLYDSRLVAKSYSPYCLLELIHTVAYVFRTKDDKEYSSPVSENVAKKIIKTAPFLGFTIKGRFNGMYAAYSGETNKINQSNIDALIVCLTNDGLERCFTSIELYNMAQYDERLKDILIKMSGSRAGIISPIGIGRMLAKIIGMDYNGSIKDAESFNNSPINKRIINGVAVYGVKNHA